MMVRNYSIFQLTLSSDDPDAALFKNKMKKKASNVLSPGISIPSQFQTPASSFQNIKNIAKLESSVKQESNFSPDLSIKYEGVSPMVFPSSINSLDSSIKLKTMSEVQRATDIKFENFKLPSSTVGIKSGDDMNLQPLTEENLI